eukprot:7696299-Pyramimonas_sp.AAC.1
MSAFLIPLGTVCRAGAVLAAWSSCPRATILLTRGLSHHEHLERLDPYPSQARMRQSGLVFSVSA